MSLRERMEATIGRALWRALTAARPSRTRAYFAGAAVSRLTGDWLTPTASADRAIRADLKTLRNRSRELVMGSGFAAGFLGLLADNVVGDAGVQLQCRIRRADGEFDKALNSLIESKWREWAEPDNASVDGMLSLVEMERLLVQGMAQDGEGLIRMVTGADNPFGFALQLLDPDLLDLEFNVPASATSAQVRMSVERNTWGRPLRYWLLTHHPNDIDGLQAASVLRQPVSASEVVLLFVAKRAGQSRGVPWFAPILLNAQMLRGYTEAELTAARVSAAKMGFLEETGEDGPGPSLTGDSGDTTQSMDAAPGLVERLTPGLTFKAWDPQHPNAAFGDFTKTILREYAAGLGASYMSLGNDLEGTSYSSGRIGMLGERDTWKSLQKILIGRVHVRVFRAWLRAARLAGQLPAESRLAEMPRAVEFRGRRWPWVDPMKDAAAATEEITNGLNSRTRILAERGFDVEEVFADLDREQQLAKKYGITLGRPQGAPGTGGTDGSDAQNQADEPAADDAEPADSAGTDGASGGRHLRRVRAV